MSETSSCKIHPSPIPMLHNVFNIVNLNIESAKPLLNQVKVVGNELSEPLLTVFIYFSVVRNFIENIVV